MCNEQIRLHCFLKCFSNLVTRVNAQNQRKYTKENATTKQSTKTISVHRTFLSDRGHVTKKGGKTKTGNPANKMFFANPVYRVQCHSST